MVWVFVAFAVLVILGAALLLTGRADIGTPPVDEQTAGSLPSGPMSAADVRAVRFRVGLRGYRMEDVDAVLAAIAADLQQREESTATEPLDSEPVDPGGTDTGASERAQTHADPSGD